MSGRNLCLIISFYSKHPKANTAELKIRGCFQSAQNFPKTLQLMKNSMGNIYRTSVTFVSLRFNSAVHKLSSERLSMHRYGSRRVSGMPALKT